MFSVFSARDKFTTYMLKEASQKEKQFLEKIVAMARGVGNAPHSLSQTLALYPTDRSKQEKIKQIFKNLGSNETFLAAKEPKLRSIMGAADAHVPGSEGLSTQARNALNLQAERIERGAGLRLPVDSKFGRTGTPIVRLQRKPRFASPEIWRANQQAKIPEARRNAIVNVLQRRGGRPDRIVQRPIPAGTAQAARVIQHQPRIAKAIDTRQAAEAKQLGRVAPAAGIAERLNAAPQVVQHRAPPPPSRAASVSASASALQSPSSRNWLLGGGLGAAALGAGAGGYAMHRAAKSAANRTRNHMLAAGGIGAAGLGGLAAYRKHQQD